MHKSIMLKKKEREMAAVATSGHHKRRSLAETHLTSRGVSIASGLRSRKKGEACNKRPWKTRNRLARGNTLVPIKHQVPPALSK